MREMRPLKNIQDNYEKFVLTLDRFSLGNYDGIKVVNVIDSFRMRNRVLQTPGARPQVLMEKE